jgi:Kef-type K+ transport system membrane component KefB
MHSDPVASLVLGLAVILLGAKLGGHLATRVGQPPVLGEIVFGVLLGNLSLAGIAWMDHVKTGETFDLLARLGVLILLFEVGLESTVGQMMRVGVSSFLVALIGVVVPMALGWGVGALLLPEASVYVHAFLGAALCATSVGITARVFKDLGRALSPEAQIILGAAVIDDVMGLVVLSVVAGAITAADRGGTLSMEAVAGLVGKAGFFLVGSLVLGALVSKKLFALASRLQARGVLLAVGLGFCFVLSWAADRMGLAPIIGAFAAGLLLEEVHFRGFVDRGEHSLQELIAPISSFLVPVFFIMAGMRTDLRVFADTDVLLLAGALTLAGIVGKQACGLGVLGRGIDRLTIGVGMIPRGEVGLIFANVGMGLTIAGETIISAKTYSALVVMVIVTTLVTPPALKWSLDRRGARVPAPSPEAPPAG